MDIRNMNTCIMDIGYMPHGYNNENHGYMRGSHGLSAQGARRTKSIGPKGLQLEVGAPDFPD